MNFNPNSPDTLGLELRPNVEASQSMTSPVNAAAVRFTAQATERIEQAAVFLTDQSEFAFYEFELFNVASLGTLETTITACLPAVDVKASNAFAQFDDTTDGHTPDLTPGSPAGIWQAIDSYPAALYRGKGTFTNSGVAIDNDELIYPLFGQSMNYACKFNGVSGVAGTKRIVSVSLKAYVQEYIDLAFVAGMSITPYLLVDGIPYWGYAKGGGTHGGKVSVPETRGGYLVEGYWTVNPSTGCDWAADDLDQFDSLTPNTGVGGHLSGGGWLIDATGSSNNLATILQAWLEIEVTDDAVDPRYAKGCLQPTVPGWWIFDLVDPIDNTIGFDKTATFDMVATLRRRHEAGRMGWRYLGGDTAASDFQGEDTTYTVDKQLLRSLDGTNERAFSLILIDDSGNVSIDSQPYASADGDFDKILGIDDDWPVVEAGRDLEQEITTVGADTYGWVRALVRLDTGIATEPLTIRIRNGAGTPLGNSVVVYPQDLESPRDGYQMVEGAFGPVALLAATQYKISFSCPATAGAGEGWRVQTLSTYLEGGTSRVPVGASTAGYGGADDAAIIDGVRHIELDLVATIATQPDPPTDLVAVATDGTEPCDQFVTLTWTGTDVSSDAGFFLQYEIEYSGDAGVTWERIAEITTEAVVTCEHRSAKRNIEGHYRMRVRRADFSCSIWTAVARATPAMDCCGYILTSDVSPELTYWVDDIGPDRTTTPLQQVAVTEHYGRDHSVVHHSLEWSGVRFTRKLMIAGEGIAEGNATPDAGSSPEDTVYGPLCSLLPALGAGLPYVTVLDPNGQRWFCGLQLGDWTHEGQGNIYTAQVTFITVTDVPSPFDVS